jgi:hypothetical protein
VPYIKTDARVELLNGKRFPATAGELNYIFSKLAWEYFQKNRNYQGINDIVGALEGAKLEFNRRVVGPYEDLKIEENGDVYV